MEPADNIKPGYVCSDFRSGYVKVRPLSKFASPRTYIESFPSPKYSIVLIFNFESRNHKPQIEFDIKR